MRSISFLREKKKKATLNEVCVIISVSVVLLEPQLARSPGELSRRSPQMFKENLQNQACQCLMMMQTPEEILSAAFGAGNISTQCNIHIYLRNTLLH